MLTSQQDMVKCAEILFKVKYDNSKRHNKMSNSGIYHNSNDIVFENQKDIKKG